MGMLTNQYVQDMGFAAVGSNVLISNKASFYGVGRISLGNNVRIDDFCVLTAGVEGIFIGSHVHIAVGSSLPTVPDEFKHVLHAEVHLAKHVIVGSGSVILPGITLEEGWQWVH